MSIFIIFLCFVLFHFALIFAQTLQPNNNWYTWIVLSKFLRRFFFIIYFFANQLFIVWIGVAFALTTAVLGIICMRNFGKGLKPFVQRGNVKAKMDIENNMKNAKAQQNWQIDDD
jgi:hypothetical protein